MVRPLEGRSLGRVWAACDRRADRDYFLPAAFFISQIRSPGGQPLPPAGLGGGGFALPVELPLPVEPPPLGGGLVRPPPPIGFLGGAFFVVESSVPVGGGVAVTTLGCGVGSAVWVGLGSGKGSGAGGGGGSGRSAMAAATIIAAKAIPPPMNKPVLLFCGGIAKSAAERGEPPPNGEPPSGPPSGPPRPPNGANPRGGAPPRGEPRGEPIGDAADAASAALA